MRTDRGRGMEAGQWRQDRDGAVAWMALLLPAITCPTIACLPSLPLCCNTAFLTPCLAHSNSLSPSQTYCACLHVPPICSSLYTYMYISCVVSLENSAPAPYTPCLQPLYMKREGLYRRGRVERNISLSVSVPLLSHLSYMYIYSILMEGRKKKNHNYLLESLSLLCSMPNYPALNLVYIHISLPLSSCLYISIEKRRKEGQEEGRWAWVGRGVAWWLGRKEGKDSCPMGKEGQGGRQA